MNLIEKLRVHRIGRKWMKIQWIDQMLSLLWVTFEYLEKPILLVSQAPLQAKKVLSDLCMHLMCWLTWDESQSWIVVS